MNIRPMTQSDLPQVFEGWRNVLIHEPLLSEEEFHKAVFGNPDYDPNGALISVDHERVIGFIFSIAPGGEQGFIVTMYVLPQYIETRVPDELLQYAENYLLTQGATRVTVGKDGVSGLIPGVDIRYENLLKCFQRANYERKRTFDDMECELRGWTPTPYQQEKMELARAYGVVVVDYTLVPQEALVEFAERAVCELPTDWFWDGWEYGPTMFVALKGEEIVGYANYWPTPTLAYGPKEGYGGFGPIGVLNVHHRHGIGTWLLVECMLQVQKLGRTHIWANWVNTPFYLANGWRFLRQYTEFEKTLRT